VIKYGQTKELGRSNVFGAQAAGVKEQPRGERARDHGDHHGDGDPSTGYEGSQQIKLHGPSIFPSAWGTEVGPNVTRTLGPTAPSGPGWRGSGIGVRAGRSREAERAGEPDPALGANPTRGI
jgi:hypothetical protein